MTDSSHQKLLRLTIMQKKSTKLTDAEFHKHWTEHHAPLVAAWLSRHNIHGFAQYHAPPETRDLTKDLAQWAGGAVAPFDAYVEFTVHSVEELMAATEDTEYAEKMRPDEAYLFEPGGMLVTLGWVETYVRDGNAVNVIDGKSAFAGRY